MACYHDVLLKRLVYIFGFMSVITLSNTSVIPEERSVITSENLSLNQEKDQLPLNYSKHGINVQTGYKGYLIPLDDINAFRDTLEITGLGKSVMTSVKLLIPKLSGAVLKVGTKLITVTVAISVLFIAGFIFTALICSLTPFCSIHLGHFISNTDIIEEKFRGYLTPEKLNTLSSFVYNAMQKYNTNKDILQA